MMIPAVSSGSGSMVHDKASGLKWELGMQGFGRVRANGCVVDCILVLRGQLKIAQQKPSRDCLW